MNAAPHTVSLGDLERLWGMRISSIIKELDKSGATFWVRVEGRFMVWGGSSETVSWRVGQLRASCEVVYSPFTTEPEEFDGLLAVDAAAIERFTSGTILEPSSYRRIWPPGDGDPHGHMVSLNRGDVYDGAPLKDGYWRRSSGLCLPHEVHVALVAAEALARSLGRPLPPVPATVEDARVDTTGDDSSDQLTRREERLLKTLGATVRLLCRHRPTTYLRGGRPNHSGIAAAITKQLEESGLGNAVGFGHDTIKMRLKDALALVPASQQTTTASDDESCDDPVTDDGDT